jgi:hypothetical protein
MMLIRSVTIATVLAATSVQNRSEACLPQLMGPSNSGQSRPAARDEQLGDERPRPPLSAAEAKLRAQKMQAIQLEILRLRKANSQVTIREINRLQAQHHELMMEIIRSIAPSGRYEYNPATDRYDRYVPYRR